MYNCRKLAKIKNLLTKNSQSIQRILFYSTSDEFNYPEFTAYKYTQGLINKNYIKYPQKSILRVDHDHVYTDHERLPTLEERLKEFADPNDKRSTVNIGYSIKGQIFSTQHLNKVEQLKRNRDNEELEKLSRLGQLKVPVDAINGTFDSKKLEEIKSITEHYNIFKDLFDCGYFYPIVNFNVQYDGKQNIFYGNKLSAAQTSSKPILDTQNLDTKKYYTLTFMNLDGNLSDNNSEVLLWFISNINKEKNLDEKEVFSYLPPFPMKGTGWHRCAYVLYEHDEPIDYGNYFTSDKNRHELDLRSFKTLDFYLKHQEKITPVSLLFFQTEWDQSVRKTFHHILDMPEPRYEYDFGKRFIPAREKFPVRQVFNWYIEDYKDIKEINEEVLNDYMKETSPFEDYPEPLIYPGVEPAPKNSPKWYRFEYKDKMFRRQKWDIVPFKYSSEKLAGIKYFKSLPFQVEKNFNFEEIEKAKKEAVETIVATKNEKKGRKKGEVKK